MKKKKKIHPIITQAPTVLASNQEIKKETRTLLLPLSSLIACFLCRAAKRRRSLSFPKTLICHAALLLLMTCSLAFHQQTQIYHKFSTGIVSDVAALTISII